MEARLARGMREPSGVMERFSAGVVAVWMSKTAKAPKLYGKQGHFAICKLHLRKKRLKTLTPTANRH